ncbi:ftsi1 [Scardovia inopinata]|uniref:Penicillin-binding protein transpeptidase domain-containing protein n=1 Tax=Scardovia inopinata F0304 TaxID=641146 RepID=W5IK65_SCAIO|nr:penicillin-binding protein 2 [Scardovia inopinata]EFG27334.2 hypothetical protein HMPREF9020_00976 [Scardovia inopinata F0304]BAR06947.1 peptidoglycan synthase [Scardovia inopinata JCM 12537]SUV51012.1 ftsi1 [Scardovia inopinata]
MKERLQGLIKTLHTGSSDPAYSKTFRRRTLGLTFLIIVLVVILIIRLTVVQLIQGPATAQQAAAFRTVDSTVQAIRGNITDTNGVVLAQSEQRYTIYADQKGARNFQPIACKGTNESSCHAINGHNVPGSGPAAVAKILAPVLGMNTMELGAKLAGNNSYIVLKKNVAPAVKRAIDKLNLSGVIGSELTVRRSYSSGSVAGAFIGGVDSKGIGVSGIEAMMNSSLNGSNGKQVYQRAGSGQRIPGTETVIQGAKNGGTVRLTIDRDVQWYLEKNLKSRRKEMGAMWGVACVQEVSTGKILAIADTNSYQAGSSQAILKGSMAMNSTFEPGSIGKLISSAGLLQLGIHKGSDRFAVPGTLFLNGQRYKDVESHGTEHLTLAGILNESSNVGMIMASTKYTAADRYAYLKKFGIGQSLGIAYPGISNGLLYPDSQWNTRTKETVLFGQGYTVNILQLSNVVATLAHGGVRVGQSIIEKSTDKDGKDTTPTPAASTRVVSKGTAADMMDMMESVMDEEYKNVIKVKGYRLAGKTGTAEVADSSGALTRIVGDTSVVIPADNPRYVITVMFMNPSEHGGIATGPVINAIGEFLMQKYKIPQSTPRKSAISTTW